jgi:signal transduction histidine kinase/DNA-binding response OmpR family regulator
MRYRSMQNELRTETPTMFVCSSDANQTSSRVRKAARLVGHRQLSSPEARLAEALITIERLEKELRHAQKVEALGLLAGGIAHDFNNLLTVLNGYNDLLLTAFELPEEVRKCLSINRQTGQRAVRLVRGLLAFSRKMPLEAGVVDVNEVVKELATLAHSLLPANIQFTTALGPHLQGVWVDPGGLQQVLLNLLMNARDAMPDGGNLEIRTESLCLDGSSSTALPYLPPGNYVLLTVSDTGSGMDEETRRRLFEPFYTTKNAGAGTGLGMHMVQHIVKQSGGFLSIESSVGAGTTIRVYLSTAGSQAPLEKPVVYQAPRTGTETILLVEDDAELRSLLCRVLEDLGYFVLEAGTAAEALELSRGLAGDVELLVADVMLPDSTGSELADRLRQERPGIGVLHLSGYAEEDAGLGARRPHAEFLSKPFTLDSFAESIRTLLDRTRRRRILFVDDDAEVVMFASRVLREAGYEVLVGGNGNVALSTAQTEPLDLLVTDLVMPEREGLETIMRLRKSHPALPVIAISGAFGGHFLKGASALGAGATLPKPFSGDELLEAVRAAIGPAAG